MKTKEGSSSSSGMMGGGGAGGGGGGGSGRSTKKKKLKGKLFTLTTGPLPQPKFKAIVA